MSRSENLYVILTCHFDDHFPKVRLHRVMDTVFCFVYDQEAVPTIGKSQRDPKQADSSVAEALQRDRLILSFNLYNRPSAIKGVRPSPITAIRSTSSS